MTAEADAVAAYWLRTVLLPINELFDRVDHCTIVRIGDCEHLNVAGSLVARMRPADRTTQHVDDLDLNEMTTLLQTHHAIRLFESVFDSIIA